MDFLVPVTDPLNCRWGASPQISLRLLFPMVSVSHNYVISGSTSLGLNIFAFKPVLTYYIFVYVQVYLC